MNSVEVYIQGKRLELFPDESISVKVSTQQIGDISKSYADYSQSFTVPASVKNNTVFKHYYNVDVYGGFEAQHLVDAQIEINGQLFREGGIELESVKMRSGEPYAYSITFYSKVATLKDILGEDKLSDLDMTRHNINYEYWKIYEGLGKMIDNHDSVMFPLIFNKKMVNFNHESSLPNTMATYGNFRTKTTDPNSTGTATIEPDGSPVVAGQENYSVVPTKFGMKLRDDYNPSTDDYGILQGGAIWEGNDTLSSIAQNNGTYYSRWGQVEYDQYSTYDAVAGEYDVFTTLKSPKFRKSPSAAMVPSFTELRPAIKVKQIFRGIERKYGITIGGNIDNDQLLDKLMLWLDQTPQPEDDTAVQMNWFITNSITQPATANQDVYLTDGKLVMDADLQSFTITTINEAPIDINIFVNGTYTHTVTHAIQPFQVDAGDLTQNGNANYIADGTAEGMSNFGLTGGINTTVSVGNQYRTSTTLTGSDISANIDDIVEFRIKPNSSAWKGYGFYYSMWVDTVVDEPTSGISNGTAQLHPSTPTPTGIGIIKSKYVSVMNIQEGMPDMKISEFVTGILNMFNGVVMYLDGVYEFNSLGRYYQSGSQRDITKYVDIADINISRPELYKELSFKYSAHETYENQRWFTENARGYGDLEANLSAGQNSLNIEIPFENVVWSNGGLMSDGSYNTDQKMVNVAYTTDRLGQPFGHKPVLFYIGGLREFSRDYTASLSPIWFHSDPHPNSMTNIDQGAPLIYNFPYMKLGYAVDEIVFDDEDYIPTLGFEGYPNTYGAAFYNPDVAYTDNGTRGAWRDFTDSSGQGLLNGANPVFNVFECGTTDAMTTSKITSSLNFYAEYVPEHGQVVDETLYDNYWKSYVEFIYDPSVRKFSVKAVLPLNDLTNLQASDTVVIRDREYIIDSATLNLTTGEAHLELINNASNFKALPVTYVTGDDPLETATE